MLTDYADNNGMTVLVLPHKYILCKCLTITGGQKQPRDKSNIYLA